MVCMFVDLARVPLSDLCFVPDVWDFRTSVTYRMRKAVAGVPKLGYLFRWLLTEQWRTNGWRIKALYGDGRRVRFECVQPVWDPQSDLAASRLKRAIHAVTPASVSPIPKESGYCSPVGFAGMGAPDVAALGWEEFVWRGQPFAFHIGSVHGKAGRFEADVERVLNEFEVLARSTARASGALTARS
jgi:hypothetical protein